MTLGGCGRGSPLSPESNEARCSPNPHLLQEACQNVQSSPWNPEIPLTPMLPGQGRNDHLT